MEKTSGGKQSLFLARRQALAQRLKARQIRGLVVSDPSNLFYLTGFRGSAGLAYLEAKAAILWVDPRYTLQARGQAQGVEVAEVRIGLTQFAGCWLSRNSCGRVGFEDTHLSQKNFSLLREAAGGKLIWVPSGSVARALRAVKDEMEIEAIRRACELTGKVFQSVKSTIRPGVRELDLAAEMEYRMKREGAEGPAFETIVASGPRTALPHARPSSKLLEEGDLVILDLGAILSGYCSDLTRTLFCGRPSARIRRLYKGVRAAQLKAIEGVFAGVKAEEVDGLARRELAARRLDKYFTHSTGHGVGIEIHEEPKIARREAVKLQPGNVITIEPGVYVEGLGGVRIEDTLLVTREGCQLLTPSPKDDWMID